MIDSNGSYRAYQADDDTIRVDVVAGGGETEETITAELLPTASCAAGAAIQFDIASFKNNAIIKQINITQLSSGDCGYTFEIWEKNDAGYTPGNYDDHYLKIFSRDIDTRDYAEIVDGGLIYVDRDGSEELHCRILNAIAGTLSEFNISVVAVV